MKINIVVDNPNNWFYERAPEMAKKIRKLKHQCSVYTKHSAVKKGSDVTFFLGCEKYITTQTRSKSKYNIVVHASDLPKGKGMSPTTWQILEGKKKIPVTLFEVSDGFDDGDWYVKDSFMLDGTELIDDWQEKLDATIERMVFTFIRKVKNIKANKQRGKSTVYKRRRPADSELDVNKSIKEQFNLLRVVDNERYPAFFMHKGKKYIVKIYKEDE